MMLLERLSRDSDESWVEAISSRRSVSLYHQPAWLELVEALGQGSLQHFVVRDGEDVIGYFVATFLKKGPFRILGSPLSGSMSEYMGPVLTSSSDSGRFLDALDRHCKTHGIHHVEIGHPWLDRDEMVSRGFSVEEWSTFRIPLLEDVDEMWSGLKGKCRNRIRKGMKNDLVVLDVDAGGFIDEHYAQLEEVFGRQGLTPEYSRAQLQMVIDRLKPHDMVFTLQVKHSPTGAVVASGIFPHDSESVYAVSTASRLKSRNLYPNELMHWTVMCMAGTRGVQRYNVGDNYRRPPTGGGFKDKFRGRYETVHRFRKNYSPLAKVARDLYKSWARLKRRRGRGRGR